MWALPFVLLFGLWAAFGINIPGPSNSDLTEFLPSASGQEFFRGAWGWFAVVVVLQVFNTVLGEDLLFRGLLLPRIRGVFGRDDFIANGMLFAFYHLHTPWSIPAALADIILTSLSHAAARERMDEYYRALGSERSRHHPYPHPRACLNLGTHAFTHSFGDILHRWVIHRSAERNCLKNPDSLTWGVASDQNRAKMSHLILLSH